MHEDSTPVTPQWPEVARRLARYGSPRLGNRRDPLSELVFVVLSAQTEEYNYSRTYRELRRRHRTWSGVLRAGEEGVFEAIAPGGLGRKKARQIVGILSALRSQTGHVSLRFLQDWPTEAAEEFLLTLPGVGAKTARCVLMYSLGRSVFPVDTHVLRVARRLGYTAGPTSERDLLQDSVPAELRYDLHVRLVIHGRRVCLARRPRCWSCSLADICPARAEPPLGPAMAGARRRRGGAPVRSR
jgi:endonuclease III